MSTYSAPVRDMQFAIHELADFGSVATLAGCEDATPDLVNSVLDEAAKFAGGVWAPLERAGDVEGARWKDGHVVMPDTRPTGSSSKPAGMVCGSKRNTVGRACPSSSTQPSWRCGTERIWVSLWSRCSRGGR